METKSDHIKIEQRPIENLIPYARNSRTHSDEQVAQIAASIREFGFTNPVLVDGKNGIIAGHGRVMAARKLGLEIVPVIELAHMSEAQKRAYIIADNKLAMNAGWNLDALKVELQDLGDMNFDVGLVGFSDEELAQLIFSANEIELPELPTGEKPPFQTMTFTLHDEQAEQVRAALDEAMDMGEFIDTGNENSNGNALARVCELFLTAHGNR